MMLIIGLDEVQHVLGTNIRLVCGYQDHRNQMGKDNNWLLANHVVLKTENKLNIAMLTQISHQEIVFKYFTPLMSPC